MSDGSDPVLPLIVIHELREPVAAIQSFLKILDAERLGSINDVQRDFVQSALHAAKRLDRLVSDVEVVIKGGTAEDFDLNCQPVDLVTRLNACCQEIAPLAEGVGTQIEIVRVGVHSTLIEADGDRLDQAFLNLLENAIRYGVTASTVRVTISTTRWHILCIVENSTDRAIKEHPNSWFQPFHRADQSVRRYGRGMGLGLAVVQLVTEAHGGRVVARARDNTVKIGFCLPRRAPVRIDSAAAMTGSERRVST